MNNKLLAYSHCTGRDWHNRKQWALIPVPVSDQWKHFHMVLILHFGAFTFPCSVNKPLGTIRIDLSTIWTMVREIEFVSSYKVLLLDIMECTKTLMLLSFHTCLKQKCSQATSRSSHHSTQVSQHKIDALVYLEIVIARVDMWRLTSQRSLFSCTVAVYATVDLKIFLWS